MTTPSFGPPQEPASTFPPTEVSTDINQVLSENHFNTTSDKTRYGATLLLTSLLSYDFLPLIAFGEHLKNNGTNGWIAGGIVAATTAVETTGASYIATAGIGDFRYEPKSYLGKKAMSATPIVSIFRGAPTGVALDAGAGKKVDATTRLLKHGIPYGIAVAFWVTPNPISETVVNTVSAAPKVALENMKEHPKVAGGALISVAAMGALIASRRKSKKQK